MNIKRMSLAAIAIIGLVTVSRGEGKTFNWTGNFNSSWTDPTSYEENEGIPGSGDNIVMTKNSKGVVSDEDMAFFSQLADVELFGENELRFTLNNDYQLNVPIHQPMSSITQRGRSVWLVKNGSGSLELANRTNQVLTSGCQSCRVSMDVQEGTLKLPQSLTDGIENTIAIIDLRVAEGASFWTCPAGCTTIKGEEVSGLGTITNAWPELSATEAANPLVLITNVNGEFPGVFAGNMRVECTYSTACTNLLTGVNSTFTGYPIVYNGGLVGVKKWGMAGEPSSIGVNGTIYSRSLAASLLCLGEESETTDKVINWGQNTLNDIIKPNILDAGAFGGVTFNGNWLYTSSNRQLHLMELTGSNTVNECVIGGPFVEPSLSSVFSWSTRITKKGTGIWRFANNAGRRNRGVIAVEEGTLRFDSLAERNVVCSLGLATILKETSCSLTPANVADVPYAILLGGGSAPVLEYTGSTAVDCSTRPIGVQGNATLRNATANDFTFSGVFGVGDGEKTLTLDGDSAVAANCLDTITNACGTLSLVKRGTGTWRLDGNQTFNGKLDVQQGTLEVHRPATKGTWLKFIVTQSSHLAMVEAGLVKKSASASKNVIFEELGFYDAAGNRVNLNFTYNSSANRDLSQLEEGQICLTETATLANAGRTPNQLCDGRKYNNGLNLGSTTTAGSSTYWATNYVAQHSGVVLRFPSSVPVITAYDFVNSAGTNADGANRQRNIQCWRIEMSHNGTDWTTVTNVVGKLNEGGARDCWESDYCWNSDGTLLTAATGARPNAGYPMSTFIHEKVSSLEKVSAVSVASGATLRIDSEDGEAVNISNLEIDAAKGIGTFDGITFTEAGTLNITGLGKTESIEFTPTLTNCTGFDRIANWQLKVDGKESARHSFELVDGKIRVTRSTSGLLFIIK